MSREQTLEIINKFCQAPADRRPEEIMQFFADEVDWFIPGNEKLAPWLGKRTTKKRYRRSFNNYGQIPNRWAQVLSIYSSMENRV